jgi:protein-tyrosine kinase
MRWLSSAPPEPGPVKHFPSAHNGNTPVSTPDVLEQLDDTSIELEQVPAVDPVLRPRRLPSLMELESAGAQKFRALAIRLQRFQKAQHLKRLLITSSVKGEGKSVISANLAVTLARRQRTLLIDGDLYQSGLREVLGSYGQLGLKDWWQGSRSILRFLRRLDGVPLWYLSAGQAHEQPLEILQSQRLAEMLNQLSVHFEWVIIDSPPLVPVADSSVWAAQTDGTLLIVKCGHTPKVLLQRALQTDNLKLLGIVTNEWEDTGHEYYSQYYKSAHDTVAPKAA